MNERDVVSADDGDEVSADDGDGLWLGSVIWAVYGFALGVAVGVAFS